MFRQVTATMLYWSLRPNGNFRIFNFQMESAPVDTFANNAQKWLKTFTSLRGKRIGYARKIVTHVCTFSWLFYIHKSLKVFTRQGSRKTIETLWWHGCKSVCRRRAKITQFQQRKWPRNRGNVILELCYNLLHQWMTSKYCRLHMWLNIRKLIFTEQG